MHPARYAAVSYTHLDDLSDFVPSSIAQNTYDGQLYAIGATESSVAFYYNKDYLKECGVDTDDLDSRTLDNPITWDEMAEIAEKCTTDNYVGAHIIMDHGEGLSLIHISTFLTDIDQLFHSALQVNEIEGIILNPWNRTIMLDKNLINIILGNV